MYILSHREPAFAQTSVTEVLHRAVEHLDRSLGGYEYVAERDLTVLEPEDGRELRGVAQAHAAANNWRSDTHFARRIDGGWEFALVIAGD